MAAKKTKTPLQKYLSKKLPPFERGTADCMAFAAGWAEELSGKKIKLVRLTFGDAVRMLRSKSVIEIVAEKLEEIGIEEADKPENGSIVVIDCTHDLGNQLVGIYSEGSVISRMVGDKLFIEAEPKILKSWTLTT